MSFLGNNAKEKCHVLEWHMPKAGHMVLACACQLITHLRVKIPRLATHFGMQLSRERHFASTNKKGATAASATDRGRGVRPHAVSSEAALSRKGRRDAANPRRAASFARPLWGFRPIPPSRRRTACSDPTTAPVAFVEPRVASPFPRGVHLPTPAA